MTRHLATLLAYALAIGALVLGGPHVPGPRVVVGGVMVLAEGVR